MGAKMAGGGKKILQVVETHMVDHETGTVKESTTEQVVRIPAEPPYVKLYLEDLGRLLDLPAGPRDILYSLARKMDYDGLISLTAAGRQRIADAHGLKIQTLNNYLSTLVKRDVLKLIGRGEFEMNPQLFAKGDWREIQRRRAAFTLTVTYSADGKRTLKGEVSDQEELPLDQPHRIAAE
jgi:hypothetical protein